MAERTDLHMPSHPAVKYANPSTPTPLPAPGKAPLRQADRKTMPTPVVSPTARLLEVLSPIVACSPCGELASYDRDCNAVSLYSQPGVLARYRCMPAQLAPTTALAMLSRCLIVGHEDGAISLVDVIARCAKVLVRDPKKRAITAIAATPRGEMIVAAASCGRLFLWHGSHLLTRFNKQWSGTRVCALAMSTNSNTMIAIACGANAVHILRPANACTTVASFYVKARVRHIAISSDNRLAAVVLVDGTIVVQDLRLNRPALFASAAQLNVLGVYFSAQCVPTLLIELDAEAVSLELNCAFPISDV
ncbi:MAG: WD40 repeat domain-containing protein [Bradymonadaceae bacterium]|nr:WD40 repeat domain-containing protein [Lujinxingiaceae bacterium]